KVVFSRTNPTPGWNNSRLAEGTLEEEIARLKRSPGKDIITYGGAGLAAQCIKLGLIDEFHLFVNPVALGNGLSIFRDLGSKLNLRLRNSQTFDCGIVLLCYQPN
ncbi:MAG TPA: dihydrofolate reductase family protein, partial [Puia sp.]|nr:dihydrofolate reductase family protein [Puia sp.]